MAIANTVLWGRYLDSVKLMQISKKIREKEGVIDAAAIVATSENKAILKETGMLFEGFSVAGESDICLAVKAESQQLADNILTEAEEWINKGLPGQRDHKEQDYNPQSLETALKQMPEANFVLISIAGKYAAKEAKKALELGRHVMLFSDNVSLEDERLLKEFAVSKGLLMMGADCGTAIINGTALAFANAVRRGKIGIVSAAGTGLQEVSSIIHNMGQGISQAFGTGGRDGKKEIDGLMLCFWLEYLINDPETEVIVLISKLPDEEVIDKLHLLIGTTDKPVVINFLKRAKVQKLLNLYPTVTLAETAKKACELLGDKGILPAREADEIRKISSSQQPKKGDIEQLVPSVPSEQDVNNFTSRFGALSRSAVGALLKNHQRKYIRGLYSGGTLCYEAQNIFYEKMGFYPFSNAPLDMSEKLSDIWQGKENTFFDLGSDEFTVGRPHPMIDYSLRVKKMEEESRNPETALILFDVVLGYGAHPKPHEELSPVIRKITKESEIITVCSVTGTDDDPQNRRHVIEELERSGAHVFCTNAEASQFAADLVNAIRRR